MSTPLPEVMKIEVANSKSKVRSDVDSREIEARLSENFSSCQGDLADNLQKQS